MPKIYNNRNSEIAPCIISKVKKALKLKEKEPNNTKNCSLEYWNEAVDIVGKINNCNSDTIRLAKENYNLFIK
jgi:hypothetical protein